MAGKRPPRFRIPYKLVFAVALIATLCSSIAAAKRALNDYDMLETATIFAESLGNRIDPPTWDTTLHVQAPDKPFWATRSQRWMYSLDNGATWNDASTDSESVRIGIDMIGSLWRCQITDSFLDGQGVITSNAFGPIQPITLDLKSRGSVAATLEPGNYLFIDSDAPNGASLSFRWQRRRDANSPYEDVEMTEIGRYYIHDEDTGHMFRCVVSGVLDGYILEEKVVTFDGVIQNPRDIQTLPTNTGTPRKNQSGQSIATAYICDSSGDGLYHRYDCDELSHARELGFSIGELPLAQAQKLYAPCPFCRPDA